MDLNEALKDRTLVLDGALGTMIQRYGFREEDFRGREFLKHPQGLSGFNDILTLTKPETIKKIHSAYLEAGANIITTNTFNANAISMKDYGLGEIEGLVKRINREAAKNVRECISKYEEEEGGLHFSGGSIGPTNRSASMSPDITDPLARNISYDELYEAYHEQVTGLIEGGVNLLIFETFFDTLNLKAGLDAADRVMKETGTRLPILVSATVSDKAGRVLSGQSLGAFLTSINHYENVAIVGLNCGFGPEMMDEYIREIRKINPHFTSCHPNAGLPDDKGCYTVDPKEFGDKISPILRDGILNVVGGCCGTTPDHVRVLAELVKDIKPLMPINPADDLRLSGLDMLTVKSEFLTVGERCNVAGSAKFLRLIKEGSLEEAADIARNQIRKGASVIDLNMDDPLLDAKKEMVKFLRYILADPEVAKVPFMIDSSNWDVIEASLKEIQGKGIVNSLSLKEGEAKFIEKARRVKELGFALVVMAFDERGQADTYERKIEVAERAYNLLLKDCGFNPIDIIFDVNVMTIATGMKEHSKYGVDFIRAVEWIKKNLQGALTSGGLSNLSFAFRGKNKIREYMHTVFLHHAKKAGLDMAIINPAQKTSYEEIPSEITSTIEDIIFDRNEEAVERLIDFANELESHKAEKRPSPVKEAEKPAEIEDILINDLMGGELLKLEAHIEKALEKFSDPIEIIEGPLLEGMKRVGERFGRGEMYLPQVVKTARSMKKAVEILTPLIEKSRKSEGSKKSGKILIATVKGDVHDIGKNIVATVLACNNYEIIDLGIMVPAEKIVETVLSELPDIICLSGLITPSLGEMAETVRQLAEAGVTTPVMVGGAATSKLHTALRIAPVYGEGTVMHVEDASQNPILASKLSNHNTREELLQNIRTDYELLREEKSEKTKIESFSKVIDEVKKQKRNDFSTDAPLTDLGKSIILDVPLSDVLPLINWKMFFLAWKLQGSYLKDFPLEATLEKQEEWKNHMADQEREKAEEAINLYNSALELLKNLLSSDSFDGKGAVRFERASGDIKNIKIGEVSFPMLRQQREGSDFLSCSDFIGEKDSYIGFFAVTAGKKLNDLASDFESKGDSYNALLVQSLADRIVEASAEWLQNYVKENIWDVNIRPAWGYPMLPDQTMIFEAAKFLPLEKIGISLTENGAMYPSASVSGLYISNPKAKYFMVGEIGEDQLIDYAERREISLDRAKSLIR